MQTTPRAFELMPEILKMLKTSGTMKKRDIDEGVKPYEERLGYLHRKEAVSFALNYLRGSGHACQPRHGFWSTTPRGQDADLSEDEAQKISNEIERNHPSSLKTTSAQKTSGVQKPKKNLVGPKNNLE